MEESEKRKDRLRAMRAGAVQSEVVDGHLSSPAPTHLLNPLVQASATAPGAERSPPASRFDYYTDPMSAYSSNKRRGGLGHHPPDTFLSPVCGSSPSAHLQSPSSAGQGRHHMTPAVPDNHFQVSYSPHQVSYATPPPVPQYGLWRSPVGMAGPFSGHNSVGILGMHDGCGSTSGSGLPHSASRGVSTSPGFGRGLSASASSGGGNLSANSGRGSSWRPGNFQSPFSGRSSRGGRGSKESVSAQEMPGLFFRKQMVLDPWGGLEPVVGCILEPPAKQMTPESLKSWLPESIRSKKAKVTETISVSNSQGSLAEYIALAFEEAVDDETGW